MDSTVIAGRVAAVRAAISAAAIAAGRPAESVELLVATKTIDPPKIVEVIAAGCTLIGENRVQEVIAKADALSEHPHRTHFIGHLQGNKVNQLLGHINCLQTLDSIELAERLDRRLAAIGEHLDVLLQVNVSGEASKAGIQIEEVPGLLAGIAELDRLTVRGYMTIGLNSADMGLVRAGYAGLAAFAGRARQVGMPGAEHAVELSMGMSGDFAEAITDGATIIRVGTAIFGPRQAVT